MWTTAVLGFVNNSALVTALASGLFNIGSRFVMGDLTPMQERMLGHRLMRKIILFCMFFITTHDVLLSLGLTLGFVLLFSVILNEHSSMCLIKTHSYDKKEQKCVKHTEDEEVEREDSENRDNENEEEETFVMPREQETPLSPDYGWQESELVTVGEEEEEDRITGLDSSPQTLSHASFTPPDLSRRINYAPPVASNE